MSLKIIFLIFKKSKILPRKSCNSLNTCRSTFRILDLVVVSRDWWLVEVYEFSQFSTVTCTPEYTNTVAGLFGLEEKSETEINLRQRKENGCR